jgi:uncharacterized OB-fold protein
MSNYDNKELKKAVYDDFMEKMAELAKNVKSKHVKHGRWIFNAKDAIEMMFTLPKCSECGAESSDASNYCPNCGAKMDEDGEDECI